MKDIIDKIGFLVLCVLILFSACADPMIPPDPDEGSGEHMIPLVIRMKDASPPLSTYGTDYPGAIDVPGSAWEDAINDLTVYVFDNSFACEEIISVTGPIAGPVMVKTGYKNLVAVVNAAGKITLPAVKATTVYIDLIRMLTDPPLTTSPTSPFLMTGQLLNVNLPDEKLISAPYDVEIEVERAVAKITMNVTKSSQAVSHNIYLTKVAMYQGADRVALFTAPSLNPTVYLITDSTDQFIPTNGFVPDISTNTFCAMDTAFYTYESLCGSDKSKAVKLVIEAYVGSTTNVRSAEFYLGEYSTTPGDTTYNVFRNYWYVVNVDIVKPGMDSIYVTVKACPWNVADTQDTIIGAGGEFKTALPFKLVQNFTSSEMSITDATGRSYAAIRNHSKGASWIDFTVTAGTKWEFFVKDNMARNQDVYYSTDSATWTLLSASGTPYSSAWGLGTNTQQRIYFYRPYNENNEPPLGPQLYVTLNDFHKEDFVIQPRDTVPIPTNSYILRPQLSGAPINETRVYIPLAGVFSHWENAILGAPDYYHYTPITATVLWQDRPMNEEVVKISSVRVINANNPDSAYIYAEAGFPGNAVIAMHLPTGTPTIHWSFHIWVTEYNPYEAAGQKLYPLSGTWKNVFMDRDLGAMNNTYDTDGTARGLFYQFGRKDPFPRGNSWTNSPLDYYVSSDIDPYVSPTNPAMLNLLPVTSVLVLPDFRPKEALQFALTYPYDFYIYTSSGQAWPLTIDNPNLWNSPGGNKTAYDPCPEGWRIPDIQTSPSVVYPWSGDLLGSGTNGFNSSIANGWYSPLVGYYPKSGYISNADTLVNSSTHGRFWTSYSDNATEAIGLVFDNNSAPAVIAIDKALGASVRCVVDKNYIRKAENGGLFGTGITNLKYQLLP